MGVDSTNPPPDNLINPPSLPPFLVAGETGRPAPRPSSLERTQRTNAGFLSRSNELDEDPVDRVDILNGYSGPGFDLPPPLEHRTKGWARRVPRKHPSPVTVLNAQDPPIRTEYNNLEYNNLKQTKLTSWLLKEPALGLNATTRTTKASDTPSGGSQPLSDSTLGGSHPPQGQELQPLGEPPTMMSSQASLTMSPTPYIEHEGDLTRLAILANQDTDWTVYTDHNRWGDTPPTSDQNLSIIVGAEAPIDTNVKTVKFNSPLNRLNHIHHQNELTSNSLSDSFSQRDLDKEEDLPMTTNQGQELSLSDALGNKSNTEHGTNIETRHKPPDLPFLAESMWRLAKGTTRAGTKARTYARHLLDLSDDDENIIITPWALGTAPIPPYISEDKGLMLKITKARILSARGLQRLGAISKIQ